MGRHSYYYSDTRRQGKLLFFLLFLFHSLLLLCPLIYCSHDSVTTDDTPLTTTTTTEDQNQNLVIPVCQDDSNSNNNNNDVIPHHQAQIDKLEQLVLNLSVLVERLESRLVNVDGEPTNLQNGYKVLASGKDKLKVVDRRVNSYSSRLPVVPERETAENENDVGMAVAGNGHGGNRLFKPGGSVTKYSPLWSEKFQFMSAVNLGAVATSVNVLPFRDFEGLSKYVAVGDDHGRVYVFLKSGDLLIEFATLSAAPVTAMLSYMSVYMNETVLVTGHSDGVILVHRIWESSSGEDSNSLHLENVATLETGSNASPVSILEVHNVGRSRYIISVDENGTIRIFRENGTLYGMAVPSSRPLAFLKQRLLFLMEKGAGSLDLRTMRIRETGCEGLNASTVKNYVFDTTERSKAYGFTSSGDLIHVLLLGDVMNFKCRVRSRKKFEMDEPLAFQAIKSYLLIIGQEKIHVYNVSTQHYIRSGAPRLTFSAGIEEIKSSFLPGQVTDDNSQREKATIPLIASDRENLVILGLGGGCVGMYRSKLPVFKAESSTVLWTSPVLFFILFLFGAWQFFAKKKEALTSWGPDDPFNSSAANAAPLGSGAGDRSFSDSSTRNADIMDLRSNGLRGTSRRYTSPSRYPAGGGGSYRPSTADTGPGPRPSSVDPNYRATSELKFRGSNLDSTAFPKRRENMFASSQVVDDGN